MLAAILAVAVATATPAASPVPGPLKTIVTVRSSTFCGQFATHVNAAISSAISNDASLGSLVATLKRPDLEGNELERHAEISRLSMLADSIYHQYRTGDAELAQLRILAAQVTDPDEKADLKAADDALAWALYRQHLIQRDLDGLVAYLNAADMNTDDDAQKSQSEALFGEPDPHEAALDTAMRDGVGQGRIPFIGPFYGLAGDESPADDARFANEAARDFISRLSPLLSDERNAATHIEAVSSRC